MLDDHRCPVVLDRWNRDLARLEVDHEVYLPDKKFNRHQGVYAGSRFTPQGERITEEVIGRYAE